MIPRIIHQVWVGPPMPAHLAAFAESWRKLHPDWEYRLWGDDDLRWLANQDLYDRAEEISPRNVGQYKSNIARCEIILREGGVYIDSDMEPRRRIDPLIEGLDAFTAWHRPERGYRKQYLTNALMGAVPGHPVFASLVEGFAASVEEQAGLRSIHTTGIRYVTRRVMAEGLLDQITVFPANYFYPYQAAQAVKYQHLPASHFRHAWAVHRWNNVVSGGWTGDKA